MLCIVEYLFAKTKLV